MEPFEGSFELLDSLAKGVEGFIERDEFFIDLVLGHDDTAYSSSVTLSSDFLPEEDILSFESIGFEIEGRAYARRDVYFLTAEGVSSTGAPIVPGTSITEAGDYDLLIIAGAYSSTIPALPSGYTSLATYSSAKSGVRVCYKILDGAAPPVTVTDTGETTHAYRFCMRYCSGIGYVYAKTGLSRNTGTEYVYDEPDSPKLDLFVVLSPSSYMYDYGDNLSSTTVQLGSYSIHSVNGSYGATALYSTYNGDYSPNMLAIKYHYGGGTTESGCAFVSVNFKGIADTYVDNTVLLISEQPDVISFSAELSSSSTPRSASLLINEPSDSFSFTATAPINIDASCSIDETASISAAWSRGIGGVCSISAVASIPISSIKEISCQSSLSLVSQAVPVSKKNTGVSLDFGSYVHTVYSSHTVDGWDIKYVDAAIYAIAYVDSSGGMDRPGDASIFLNVDIGTVLAKRLLINCKASHDSSVGFSISKDAHVSSAITSTSEDSFSGDKFSLVESSIDMGHVVVPVPLKHIFNTAFSAGVDLVYSSSCRKGALTVADVQISESVISGTAKSLFSSALSIILESHNPCFVSKGISVGVSVDIHNANAALAEKGVFSSTWVIGASEALSLHSRQTTGDALISMLESIPAAATIQISFLSADLWIVDLPARVRVTEFDCSLQVPELCARLASYSADLDASIIGLSEECRRRGLALCGKIAEISGIRLVGVRRTFDDE